MKRIRSVQINGHRWRVIWLKLKEDWGLCSKDEHVIELDSRMDDPVTVSTVLIHEMLHGMWPEIEEDYIELRAAELVTALDRMGLIAEDD